MMPTPEVSGTVSRLRAGLRVQPGPTQVRVGTQPRSTNDEVRLAWPGGLKAFQSFSDLEKGATSFVHNSSKTGTQVQIIPNPPRRTCRPERISDRAPMVRTREGIFSPIGSSQSVISAGAPCPGAARPYSGVKGILASPEIRCHLEKYRGKLAPPHARRKKFPRPLRTSAARRDSPVLHRSPARSGRGVVRRSRFLPP
jgi:hypothetical protein